MAGMRTVMNETQTINALGDQVLVGQCMKGSREAWHQLLQRHGDHIAAYLCTRVRRHHLVEQLVVDTAVAAWRHLGEWNANEEDFPAWLRRIAAGVAVRWHRRNPNEPLTETYPLDLARNMKEAQAFDRLEKAMDTLSRTERTLLEQDSRAGLRVDAMAAVCHISPSEVAALKERALERLAAAYAAQQSLI